MDLSLPFLGRDDAVLPDFLLSLDEGMDDMDTRNALKGLSSDKIVRL